MTVADCLRTWKNAHDAAKQARYRRNLAENALQLAQARQSLLDAHILNPDHIDPAWSLLPCSLADLNTFYAKELDTQKILAPRFTVQTPEKEQDALRSMTAQVNAAKLKAGLPVETIQ